MYESIDLRSWHTTIPKSHHIGTIANEARTVMGKESLVMLCLFRSGWNEPRHSNGRRGTIPLASAVASQTKRTLSKVVPMLIYQLFIRCLIERRDELPIVLRVSRWFLPYAGPERAWFVLQSKSFCIFFETMMILSACIGIWQAYTWQIPNATYAFLYISPVTPSPVARYSKTLSRKRFQKTSCGCPQLRWCELSLQPDRGKHSLVIFYEAELGKPLNSQREWIM
jgi:hypothetical protein